MNPRRGASNYEVDRDCALTTPEGRTLVFTPGEELPTWATSDQIAALVESGAVTEFGVL